MTPASEALRAALADGRLSVALRGQPGVGKSALVRQVAENLGLHLEVVVGSTRDPSDIAGLPIVHNGQVHLAPPNWAVAAAAASSGAVVLLDELTTMAPLCQAACFRIILDKVVGDYELGPSVRIVGAYNDAADCGGYELELPMRSRLCHLEIEPSVDEFAAGLTGGWPGESARTPPAAEVTDAAVAHWKQLIAGFVRAHPTMLSMKPGNDSQGGYPTPRSWEAAAIGAGVATAHATSEQARNLLIAGAVGVGAAAELLAYTRMLDLPDPAEVLRDPRGFDLRFDRGRPDATFVTLTAVVDAAVRAGDARSWNAAWVVMARAVRAGFGDLVAWTARPLVSARPSAAKLPPEFAEVKSFLEAVRS